MRHQQYQHNSYHYVRGYQQPRQNLYIDPEMYAKSDFNNRQNQPVYQTVSIDFMPVININNNKTKISQGTLRKRFFCKVFAILIAQLIFVTFAIAWTLFDKENTREWIKDHFWPRILAAIVFFMSLAMISCFRNVFKGVFWSFFSLTFYTLSIAYFLAYIAAVSKSTTVLFAAGFTLFAVFVFVCYLCITSRDLNMKIAAILSVTSLLLMILIFGLIFKRRIINVIIGAVFGLVFSFLFAHNIQKWQKLSRKGKSKFSWEECILVAMCISFNIADIFRNTAVKN